MSSCSCVYVSIHVLRMLKRTPHPCRCETTEMCSPTVMQVRSPKPASVGHIQCRTSGPHSFWASRESVLPLRLAMVAGVPWLVAAPLPSSRLTSCLCSILTSPSLHGDSCFQIASKSPSASLLEECTRLHWGPTLIMQDP